ncbi:GAF domain-containing sensor histidine kinase [Aneurinibacillus sp. UBA3580]|nr:ATP-binding protein [Aneurinibacillus sp. UBA3580]
MRKKTMVLWISASFLVPILLSVVFALSVNLLHMYQLAGLLQKPFLGLFTVLFSVFFCALVMQRFDKWLIDVSKQKENGLVQASLRRILYEYVVYSIVSFLFLAFLFFYQVVDGKKDMIFIVFICIGVIMTTYAPFYFGILMQVQRDLYRNGFPIQFEKVGWNQSAVTAVIMAFLGIFITTTLFVYIISKTIGNAITLYDVWQRALVVIVVVGVPLVMLILMIRRFYLQQLKYRQQQLHSLHLLLEKLYGSLELTDGFLEDMVATVGQVIGARKVTLTIILNEGKEKRIISSNKYADTSLISEHEGSDSFLEVPVVIGKREVGRFSLIDKVGAFRFTKEDEEMMMSFSRAFAVALQNSHYIEELKKERRIAQEAANLKSQILSTMSHELRTPLNAIIGYSDIVIDVLEGSVPEKQVNNIKRIKESGKHLLAVINDILDLSKMEAGRMALVIEPVYIQSLLRFCMHNAESLRGDKPILLRIEGETDIWIQSDEQKLKQIVMNLVSNAIKFTEQGFVTVRLTRDETDILIAVEDTGIGISPEHHAMIFEPFKQIDGSLARKYKGTGLGLSVTARLVSLLNGTISVESEQGKGSCFTVRLANVFHK